MTLRAELRGLVACPDDDHGALHEATRDGVAIVVCESCGKGYRIDGDIPVLLLDDALPAE